MTWEELKEKAKEMGYRFYKSSTDEKYEWFCKDGITFDKRGIVFNICTVVKENRTPDQMLMIMRGLE